MMIKMKMMMIMIVIIVIMAMIKVNVIYFCYFCVKCGSIDKKFNAHPDTHLLYGGWREFFFTQ